MKKLKIFLPSIALIVVLAFSITIGVYAASSVSFTINSSVIYISPDLDVRIEGHIGEVDNSIEFEYPTQTAFWSIPDNSLKFVRKDGEYQPVVITFRVYNSTELPAYCYFTKKDESNNEVYMVSDVLNGETQTTTALVNASVSNDRTRVPIPKYNNEGDIPYADITLTFTLIKSATLIEDSVKFEDYKFIVTKTPMFVEESALPSASNSYSISEADGLKDFIIKGNSTQGENPSPENPQEIVSYGDRTKNLLPGDVMDISSYVSLDGLTHPTAYWLPSLEAGKEYMVSCDYNKVAGEVYYYIYKYQNETPTLLQHFITNATKNGKVKYTFTAESGVKYLFYGNNQRYLINALQSISNFQIEEGNVATEYEPYGYKVPIYVSGKNLFNQIAFYEKNPSYSSIGDDGLTITARNDSGWATMDTVMELSAGTYTMSTSQSGIKVDMRNSNNVSIFNTELPKTFTLTETTGLKFKFFSTSTYPSNAGFVQIEKGSVATDYVPYVESTTYNIYLDEPLRKIGDTYDYIDLVNKKVVRNVASITYDGSSDEAWTTYSQNQPYYGYMINNGKAPNLLAKQCICDKLPSLSSYANIWYGKELGCFMGTTNGPTSNFVMTSTATTVSELKTQLASNPLNIIYVLETANEISLDIPNVEIGENSIITIGTESIPSEVILNYWTKYD